MMNQRRRSFIVRAQIRFVSLFYIGIVAVLCSACGDDDPDSFPSDDDIRDGVVVPTSELTAEQTAILDAHNVYRASSVTPAPSPELPGMRWDAELARVAQTYADKCVWAHNQQRTNQYRGEGYVGENLSATSGQTEAADADELVRLVTFWTDEDVDYNYSGNSCAAGKVCGHYTQVVWRNTTRVGCGWALCGTLDNLSDWRNPLILVCNYAPGGNYVGERPY